MNYSEFYLTFEGNYTNSLQSLSEDRRKVNLSNLAASVVSDSVRPHRRQPTRLLHPQDSLGKNTGVGCHALLQGMFLTQGSTCGSCIAGGLFTAEPPGEPQSVSAATAAAKSLQSCLTLCDPIDSSPPGSPSLGFFRQKHWSGLPFPSPMHESEK